MRYGDGTPFRSRHTARAASPPTTGATAMTDVSDGLVADLGHIADASGVGVNVSTAALAADRDALAEAAAVAGGDAWAWVLGGGEDHALVATFHGTPPRGWRASAR